MSLPTQGDGPFTNNPDPTYDPCYQDLQNDTDNYCAELNQMNTDQEILNQVSQELGSLLAAAKTNPQLLFVAVMYMFTNALPAVQTYQGDQIGMLSAQENIGSDLRTYVNDIETAFNNGASTPSGQMGPNNIPANAQTMTNETNDLYLWTQYLSGKTPSATDIPNGESITGLVSSSPFTAGTSTDPGNAPLSTDTAGSIQSSLLDTMNQFVTWTGGAAGQGTEGAAGSGWGNLGWEMGDMNYWYAQGTTPGATPSGGSSPSAPAAPAPQIRQVQNDLQQSNQNVSTMSTNVTTQEQFYAQEINQLYGIDNSIQQSIATEMTTMVQNQQAS